MRIRRLLAQPSRMTQLRIAVVSAAATSSQGDPAGGQLDHNAGFTCLGCVYAPQGTCSKPLGFSGHFQGSNYLCETIVNRFIIKRRKQFTFSSSIKSQTNPIITIWIALTTSLFSQFQRSMELQRSVGLDFLWALTIETLLLELRYNVQGILFFIDKVLSG